MQQRNCVIALAVVRFAVSLGKTTAEGGETAEQLEILRAENCTQMQGYCFSRPKHSSEICANATLHMPDTMSASAA